MTFLQSFKKLLHKGEYMGELSETERIKRIFGNIPDLYFGISTTPIDKESGLGITEPKENYSRIPYSSGNVEIPLNRDWGDYYWVFVINQKDNKVFWISYRQTNDYHDTVTVNVKFSFNNI